MPTYLSDDVEEFWILVWEQKTREGLWDEVGVICEEEEDEAGESEQPRREGHQGQRQQRVVHLEQTGELFSLEQNDGEERNTVKIWAKRFFGLKGTVALLLYKSTQLIN